MYNKKRELTPAIPKSTAEIVLSDEYTVTGYGERFLLFDTQDSDRIICFSSDCQLDVLRSADVWHVDGTFSSRPDGYKQVFNVHGWYENEMYHCATITLKNKELSV